MHASDLVKVFEEFNSHEEELFDKCTDKLILLIKSELEKIYANNGWLSMISASKLGIYVNRIKDDFSDFELGLFWPFYFDETPENHDEFINFDEFIKDKTFDEIEETFVGEICGFSAGDIIALKPFCNKLKEKGFECYFNDYDGRFFIVFSIK